MRRTLGTLIVLVAACCLLPLLVASPPQQATPRGAAPQQAVPSAASLWEYKAVSLLDELRARKSGLRVDRRYRDIEKSLNKLGGDGWELAHAAEDLFIFKRPKPRS